MGTIGQLQIATGRFRLHPAPYTPKLRAYRRPAGLVRPGSKGPKGRGPISKNQTKGIGLAARLAKRQRPLASRLDETLGAARPYPVGGTLPRPPPPCAPHIAKSGTPAMTRPVATGNAHTGRTAPLSGPASARSGMRSIASEEISKNKEKKEKGGRV
jgi:hypothetical protein